jgi:hypothetical protein
LFIILLCIVVFFLQNDNYRIFFSFVSYEALFGYTPTLILLSLPLSLISGITCLALCAWNLWHKDSKWLLIIALLAILGVTASFLSTVMMGMGGPAYRETKLEDCPYHNTTTTRDSCYSLAANSVKTCKKITDINLQDKCYSTRKRYLPRVFPCKE